MRLDPSGRLYAAGLQEDGTIWIFDGGNYRNIYAADAPKGAPVDLAFDSMGNVLFLGRSPENRSGFLLRLERDTHKELERTILPELTPAAMAVAPDGSVYLTGVRGVTPVVLRLLDGKTSFALDLGMAWPQAVVAGPDGAFVAGAVMKGYPLVKGFISRLDPALTPIEKTTFLGGEATDPVNWLSSDDEGRILAAGITNSYDLPATGAFRTPCGPNRARNATGASSSHASMPTWSNCRRTLP